MGRTGWRLAAAFAAGVVMTGADTAPTSAMVGSGTLTYEFRGSPALGCADAGLCTTSGTLTLTFQDGNDGPEVPHGPPVLHLSVAQQVATADTASGASCTEPNAAENGLLKQGFARTLDFNGIGELTLPEPRLDGSSVEHLDPTQGLPGGSRCAGPLPADLAQLPITVTRSGGEDPSFTFTLGGTAAAGPFTLQGSGAAQLVPGGGGFTSVTFGGGGPGKGLPFTYEQATLRERPERGSTPLTAHFAEGTGPFCAPLASCGVTGTLAITVLGSPAPSTITMTRIAYRHANRARALADLTAGRLEGAGSGPIQIAVDETLTRDGAVTCRSSRTEVVNATYDPTTRRGEAVTLTAPGPEQTFDAAAAMRTYCPGPADVDALGRGGKIFADDNQAIAQGIVPLEQFAGARTVAGVARSGGFDGDQYRGSWTGVMRFPLRQVGRQVTIRHSGYREPVAYEIPKGDT